MGFRNGVAACAVSVLATVFSVQQGEHGPLVVYKLQVPQQTAPAAQMPANRPLPETGVPRLRSTITNVPQRPATLSGTMPRSQGTVVMPASALPPPRVTPVVTPIAVPPAPARPLPTLNKVVVQETAPPASLQPRILGTVAISDIEALTRNRPFLPPPAEAEAFEAEPFAAGPFVPTFRVLDETQFGTAMVNEETGENLTLQEVNDAVTWRRDTVERLRAVPIAPRF